MYFRQLMFLGLDGSYYLDLWRRILVNLRRYISKFTSACSTVNIFACYTLFTVQHSLII